MEIISTVALISINETLIFQVISFLIFLFIINRILFRPLRRTMADRDIYIENIQKDIIEAQSQVKDLTKQIQKQEKAIRNEAFEQQAKLEAAGSQQAEELLASVRKEVNASKEQARINIEAQISAARKHIQKESEDLAKNIMEKVLHRRLIA
jgi:F-type H+-transporting ATPase subunit b